MTSTVLGQLRSYRDRPLAERRLLREATAVVALVRLSLSLLPYRLLRSMAPPVRSLARRLRARGGTPAELARAVGVAARHVRRASCLTQALALDLLLRRRGVTAELVIGVAPSATGIDAHAWLEQEGAVLIGGDVARYHRLATAKERST